MKFTDTRPETKHETRLFITKIAKNDVNLRRLDFWPQKSLIELLDF